MSTTITYTIPKVRKGTNLPYFGLDIVSFLLPFPYFQTSDVVVALRGDFDDDTGRDDVLLTEGQNYSINGSMLTIDEQSLGLDSGDSLAVSLSATRNTQLDISVFTPGHPITAYDLNHNFEQMVYLIEENQSLILNNTYVSDTAPVNPYKGQTWLRTPYYVHYIFDGSVWVQPS